MLLISTSLLRKVLNPLHRHVCCIARNFHLNDFPPKWEEESIHSLHRSMFQSKKYKQGRIWVAILYARARKVNESHDTCPPPPPPPLFLFAELIHVHFRIISHLCTEGIMLAWNVLPPSRMCNCIVHMHNKYKGLYARECASDCALWNLGPCI